MKIALVSNSQGTRYDLDSGNPSYPELLQKQIPEVAFQYFLMPRWSIKDVNTHRDNIEVCQADMVILQIGIMECAQRILSTKAKNFFSAVPLGRFVTHFMHNKRTFWIKLRSRLGMEVRDMNTETFAKECRCFDSYMQELGIKYLFCLIPEFSEDYSNKYFPYINEDIRKYNDIMRTHPHFRLPDMSDDKYWQTGTVHFSPMGHKLVSSAVAEKIQSYL